MQHDPAGLIALMGGREKFAAKLDQLFVEQYGTSKFTFLGQFPDMTGLIGLYPQGNEPAFHIPYLFDYCGQPWKTQRRVRQIMDVWYGDGPLGICGDEDGGAMSSWYVLSAMGFYPVSPGQPAYEIGSPLFEETRIALDRGKVFTITAKNVSAQNKYVQSATLNGKPWDKAWFAHSGLAGGGTLVLVMGPRPNTAWGSAPEAVPPSMSRWAFMGGRRILLALSSTVLLHPAVRAQAVDPSTLKGKVLLGYQGWFRCPGGGTSGTNWSHWTSSGPPAAASISIDMYPDMREFEAGEACAVPNMTVGGTPAYLFSEEQQDASALAEK